MNVGGLDHIPLGQRARALDDVLQFAHVPRPVIIHQNSHRLGRNAFHRLTGTAAKPFHEKTG